MCAETIESHEQDECHDLQAGKLRAEVKYADLQTYVQSGIA